MSISFYAMATVVVSGFYTCLWGAFKDSPFETFKPKTFPRSVYFSIAIYLIVLVANFAFAKWCPDYISTLDGVSYFKLFFFVMGLERFLSELYKGFFRTEDQKKYFIPSRITFFGKHVSSNLLRYGVGVLLVALTFSVSFLRFEISAFWQFAIVSYCVGSIVALGGAYKDAPFEGFDPIKFQRSGMVVLFAATPLFYFLGATKLGILIFMCGGLERFLVEYYKTYIQRNMSGKFQPDTVRIQKELDTREKFHYMAWVIILGVAALYVCELTSI